MATIDGLRFADEVEPVAGSNTGDGKKISNALTDKFLAINGELFVGAHVEWFILNPIKIRALRLSFGVSLTGTDFRVVVKKNGVAVTSTLVIPAGVLAMEFPISVFTNQNFVANDVLRVEVTAVNGGKSAYHMNAQLNYSY